MELRNFRADCIAGIFELCQSIGKVMGVLPRMLKSKALCVYFQMYSPLTTTFLPKLAAGWRGIRCEPWVQGSRYTRRAVE